ncbi:hypothetical protein [Persicitalea jodogahamensis]|uniref:DUF748 domain-containing protein n=1 Tax=Persicitalea jodogahamensis TaxID=402147 RepID=A0A8J3G7Y6_9BACT|nr:hypothetical protein [Persicitalea jodogahamensis]GHB52920.1 hypothetical protein GCM10007390_01990 [Persicitalea jodogahamensis]
MQTRYKKWLLWILGLGGGLFLLGLLLSWWLPVLFKDKLDNALRESVVNASDSLYQISYDGIDINIPLGNAEVRGVKLTPDSTVYRQLVQMKNAPNDLFDLQAARVQLRGISLWQLLFFKSLRMGGVLINRPVANIVHDPKDYNENKPRKSPYELISKLLNSIRIDKISLDNVDFTFEDRRDTSKEPQKSELKKLYLDVTGFVLDEESEKDTSRLFFSDDISLRAEGLELPSGNKQYIFKMAELSFSSKDSTLQVKKVLYKPLLSKNEFSRAAGYAADRLDLEFNDIKATQVDVKRFLMDRQLFAKRLDIDAGLIDVDKDKRYPADPSRKSYLYPHQLLLKAKTKVGFEKVYLKSTRVRYGELNPKTDQRGAVYFDGTNGTITNLTNDSAWVKKNPRCRVNVNTRFMGTGKLNAYFVFNLASRAGDFSCGGKMSDFDMTKVNGVTKALAKASVQSGRVSKLDFNINANSVQSSINLQLQYDNLEVNVLKVDDETGRLKKRGFLSRVANNIVLNENNPREGRPIRVGEGEVLRAEDESFFNLIWHTIFVGIKDVVIGRGKK